jgi:alpha-ketoglutarate-dependent taurine dioxygenase
MIGTAHGIHGTIVSAGDLPVEVAPPAAGDTLDSWLKTNADLFERTLQEAGAILFSGFQVTDPETLESAVVSSGESSMVYSYRSTPREQIAGSVYTSTKYPADQTIPLHNEMSYANEWPLHIWFACAQAAPVGGETPIADSRNVLRRLDAEVVDRFRRKGVMYVRNYGSGLGMTWQEVFQTQDPESVGAYCEQSDIECDWLGTTGLRTCERRPAIVTHPRTGEATWFNQAHLYHVSALPQETRQMLVNALGEDGLPRHCYHGDGSQIDAADLDLIRAAYDSETRLFAWQKGDVLALDNVLVAHGRRPFKGQRDVLVAMANAQRWPTRFAE